MFNISLVPQGYSKKSEVREELYQDLAKEMNEKCHGGASRFDGEMLKRFHTTQRTALGKLRYRIQGRKKSGTYKLCFNLSTFHNIKMYTCLVMNILPFKS